MHAFQGIGNHRFIADQQQESHTNHPPAETPAHSYQPVTSAEYHTKQTSDL